MDGKLDIKKSALALGLLFAVWHLGWLLAVAVFGNAFVEWTMDMHLISLPIPIAPFDFITLVIGVISAFICGALTGAVFALIWNKL